MAEISVPYTVPVQAVVDTETKQVLRVVVIDEGIMHDESELAFWERRDGGEMSEQLAAEALAVAEAAEWPSWQAGW